MIQNFAKKPSAKLSKQLAESGYFISFMKPDVYQLSGVRLKRGAAISELGYRIADSVVHILDTTDYKYQTMMG